MRLLPLFFMLVTAVRAGVPVESVQFETADGVTIHGELFIAGDTGRDAPLILLFHQGASNARAEYEPLVGRLLAAGYHALAIDQRRGGSRLGGENRTVAGYEGPEPSYCDVYPDLVAAMNYAKASGFSGPLVAWGSSYSAALAIQLGYEYPQHIKAVVAFSPASGEPMAGCEPDRYTGEIEPPLLALRPAQEMEYPWVAAQLNELREAGHRTHVADPGVHGSSMLNEARVGADTGATWAVVLDFIESALD